MKDLTKVVYGLECLCGEFRLCKQCGYANVAGGGRYPQCHREVAADAMKIINDQQKRISSQQETIEKLNASIESAYDQGFDNGQKNVLEAQEG